MNKKIGPQTVELDKNIYILSSATIVGQKESKGPLKDDFDIIMPDAEWNEESWEKTESKMQKEALKRAVAKADLKTDDLEYIFAGDLLNQCIGAGFGFRDMSVPYFGIYGACSTMIEGLSLGSMLIGGGSASTVAAVTSSHFCTAERQYRMPLEYGGQRTPTAQWTVTGTGAIILSTKGSHISPTLVTTGKIIDMGVKDANNMGGAMAPAACDTLIAHFKESRRSPDYYDMIFTGDLGSVGSEILIDLLSAQGYDVSKNYKDCGCMIYDMEKQDVHAGGSGCGCIASVLCGHIMNELSAGRLEKVLMVGTGAMLSTTSGLQGESVPSIAHAVAIERV